MALIFTQTQEQFQSEKSDDLLKLAANYPGIEKTSEYSDLKTATASIKEGLFFKSSAYVVWQRVLANIKNRYDGMTVAKVLDLFRQTGTPATRNQASRFIAQAKLKAELGVGGD